MVYFTDLSMIMKYKENINFSFKILLFFVPIILTYIIHYVCNYFYCDEWYSLLGFNMFCNACIDTKKILKDHQINIYIYIGTYLLTKVNGVVTSIINKIS